MLPLVLQHPFEVHGRHLQQGAGRAFFLADADDLRPPSRPSSFSALFRQPQASRRKPRNLVKLYGRYQLFLI